MLLLTRRIGERIVIDEKIYLKIVNINGRQAIIGFDAPDNVKIHREEVQNKIDKTGYIQRQPRFGEKMQLHRLITQRYTFGMKDGMLHYQTEDGQHEGLSTLNPQQRLTLLINLKRLTDAVKNGEA